MEEASFYCHIVNLIVCYVAPAVRFRYSSPFFNQEAFGDSHRGVRASLFCLYSQRSVIDENKEAVHPSSVAMFRTSRQ